MSGKTLHQAVGMLVGAELWPHARGPSSDARGPQEKMEYFSCYIPIVSGLYKDISSA